MIRLRPKGALIPPWKMPSDPIKAVFWFMHWLLRVLVRFFWILILAGVVYESILNGVVGGIVTLLVGARPLGRTRRLAFRCERDDHHLRDCFRN